MDRKFKMNVSINGGYRTVEFVESDLENGIIVGDYNNAYLTTSKRRDDYFADNFSSVESEIEFLEEKIEENEYSEIDTERDIALLQGHKEALENHKDKYTLYYNSFWDGYFDITNCIADEQEIIILANLSKDELAKLEIKEEI